MMRRTLLVLFMLGSLVIAAPAHASSTGEVGIADDAILLKGSDADRSAAVAKWSDMGVDIVRVFARWKDIAPGGDTKRTKPSGFNPADPDDSQYHFAALDRAIAAVRSHGMRVMLNITGPGPCWTTSKPKDCNRGRFMPSPSAYADFASAVSKRYGSSVDEYILWNEPNQTDWLQPQAKCVKRKCAVESAHVYRKLVVAAIPKVRAADPTAKILVGALAPRGKTLAPRTNATYYNATIHPLDFIRAMGCVDSKYRKVRTGSCKGFKPIEADGFAYHPHGIKLSPTQKSPVKSDAQIADLSRLESVLDKVQSKGGFKVRGSKHFNLYLDEWAYQTNPPDKFSGVSLSDQAKYMAQGAFIAWRNSRVMNLTQYEYRDEPGVSTAWQSGLTFIDGRAKPSLAVFPIPFWAQKSGANKVQLWGQVRAGKGTRSVQLQRLSGNTWVTISTVNTNAYGYYTSIIPRTSATTYRAVTPEGATARRTIF